MEWIKANIWEVRQSSSLKFFGVLLGICHIFNYFSWNAEIKNIPLTEILCWSFVPQCHEIGLFSATTMQALATGLLITALFSAIGFAIDRLEGLGMFLLFISFCLHLLIYLSRYNLYSNAQTLLVFVQIAFLFIPQKIRLIKWLILGSYIITGLLKFNSSWLGGFWFESKVNGPAKMMEWLAALCLIIEFTLSWGLMFREKQKFTLFFLIMVVYHMFMMSLGLGLPSTIHLLLLTIFMLSYMERARLEREYLYQSYIRPEPSKIWIALGLSVFLLLQLLPHFLLTWNETPMTLRPLNIEKSCRQFSFVTTDKTTRRIDLNLEKSLPKNFSCHTSIRRRLTQKQCKLFKSKNPKAQLSSFFLVHTPGDKKVQYAFEELNICSSSQNSEVAL